MSSVNYAPIATANVWFHRITDALNDVGVFGIQPHGSKGMWGEGPIIPNRIYTIAFATDDLAHLLRWYAAAAHSRVDV